LMAGAGHVRLVIPRTARALVTATIEVDESSVATCWATPLRGQTQQHAEKPHREVTTNREVRF
jgi:hypothetical protein